MAKKKVKVAVTRYYIVTDTIEVEIEESSNFLSDNVRAREKAEEISNNKDYTGNFNLDEVITEVISGI